MLTGMRQFLAGLQQMTDALSRGDMETVTREARIPGSTMSQHMPADLKQALPRGFRRMGHAVYSSFDQIALDTESLGDVQHILSQHVSNPCYQKAIVPDCHVNGTVCSRPLLSIT
jgi:hypothetical protein